MFQEKVKKKRELFSVFVFLSAACLFLFIFFTRVNPIVVFDSDDWLYVYSTRPATPLWGEWNPSRILPEVLMSLVSEFGVYIINPFLNDYISSISIAYAIALSIFICLYLYRFNRFIKARFSITTWLSLLVSFLFLALHFLVFRHFLSNNEYLFRANDATCYFYYTIPSLINASIVLFFVEKNRFSFHDYESKSKLGILFLCIYFAVFSNLFPTIILISCLSFVILKEFVVNHKASLKSKIKNTQIPIICILLWGVSLLFEFFGGRARRGSNPFDLVGTLKSLYSVVVRMNGLFVLILLIAVLILTFLLISNRKDKSLKPFIQIVFFCAFGVVFTLLFNIILCAKVDINYIHRSEILICVFFYVFLLISAIICKILKHNFVRIILPLLIVVVCSFVFTSSRTFMESNTEGFTSEKCKQIDEYLIEQIVKADENGLKEIQLHVPVFEDQENWPITEYGAKRIPKALYKHHIVQNEIEVVYYPDITVNEQFDLDIPK